MYLSPVCLVPCRLVYCYSRCVYLALCYPDVVIKDYYFEVRPRCACSSSLPAVLHRDRRPDQTVSVVPSPRFVLFVFSSVFFVSWFCPSRQASPHAASLIARRSREFMTPFAALPSRGSREFTPPFAALPSRGSRDFLRRFAAQRSRRSRELTPPFAALPSRRSRGVHAAVRGSTSPQFTEMTPPSPANPSPPACPLTQCPPACL